MKYVMFVAVVFCGVVGLVSLSTGPSLCVGTPVSAMESALVLGSGGGKVTCYNRCGAGNCDSTQCRGVTDSYCGSKENHSGGKKAWMCFVGMEPHTQCQTTGESKCTAKGCHCNSTKTCIPDQTTTEEQGGQDCTSA